MQDPLSPRYAYSKFGVRDHDSSGAAAARTNYSPARLLADCVAADVLGGLRDRASFKNPRRGDLGSRFSKQDDYGREREIQEDEEANSRAIPLGPSISILTEPSL
jgi:hypothetical protein